MPVEYTGITDEHLAVRTRAGLFDVSHMGEIELAGADALAAVQWMTSNDASRLSVGQAQYSALTTPAGTFVDDVLVYRLADDALPARRQRREHREGPRVDRARSAKDRRRGRRVVNSSSRYALIGAAGPGRRKTFSRPHGHRSARHQVLLVRDGRSRRRARDRVAHGLYGRGRVRDLRPARAGRARVGRRSSRRPAGRRLKPCGLGARDTLRLEACMRLCGNDMDEPDDRARGRARLDCRLEEGRLPRGRSGCASRRRAASPAGWWRSRWRDRAIARHGYPVLRDGTAVRRRDERHADAVPEEGHRPGDGAGRPDRRSAPGSMIDVRGRRVAARGRAGAVLQASRANGHETAT